MSYSDLPNKPTIPVEPFKLSVPDEDINELRTLLKSNRIAKESYENVSAEENKFGITRKWLVNMKDEWIKLDWRRQEERINSLPAFKTKVKNSDGSVFSVHFTALFSKKKDAVPIILSHGWPGSFYEFVPMMEMVKKKYSPEDLPFHLIVPSLPGWLFSTPPPKDREFKVKDVGYLFNGLMEGLGFGGGYVAQGGDIGSYVSNELGANYPACKIIHVNYSNPPPRPLPSPGFPEQEASPPSAEDLLELLQKFGYALEHSTRPATVGLVVGSNPLSLLAWIGEKFLEWTDESPSVETTLTMTSLYWFTDCFTTSIYTYRYGLGAKRHETAEQSSYQKCPLGYSQFPKEIVEIPAEWVKAHSNMVWSKKHKSGGHFAALEKPELLWADIEEFVNSHWEKYKDDC
ncbi:microsomal epoxide hydrolase [Cryptococcus neoformans]|nr:microsomal epoxide hydrolase [Cryptococcus neoformans var. grubii]